MVGHDNDNNILFCRFTYELETYRKSLDIKEFYPEKNPHECKIKKEYGNKAYQDGKDIDALHFYTQVIFLTHNFGKAQ